MVREQNETSTIPKTVLNEVSRVVVGKEDERVILMAALLCGGHVLVEGPQGSAKTTMAKTFAKAIGGELKRIQFTPDTLPTDLTGFYLYTVMGNSKFISGPVFANIVLADELNRTTPRTQSALLEAMQENQVTVEGDTYPLPTPFMVIATQLRYGAEGTYPLTEVQSDRFMFRVRSEYTSHYEELQVLDRIDFLEAPEVAAVTGSDELMRLREEVKKVYVCDEVRSYIVSLIEKIRYHRDTSSGPSPRASISLFRGSRALAYINGRDFVLPDDVKLLVRPVVTHRMRVRAEAEMENVNPESIINKALEETPVPKVK